MESAIHRRVAHALAATTLLFALAYAMPAHGQPAPPGPGTSNHDTNGDGTQDLAIIRSDTDGNPATTEKIHIDSNRNGVEDAGERVFLNVVGYTHVGGAAGLTITIVEDSGTESVKTKLDVFNKNPDGDCEDAGEIVQVNSMPDSVASMQISLGGAPLVFQLRGASEFAADLNRVVPDSFGRDTIPIELVAMSLTGGPQPIAVRLLPMQPSAGLLVENVNFRTGSLDARLFAPNGTLDSFFDVYLEIDLSTGRLIHHSPLRLMSPGGIYPPAPGQTYFLVNPGVPLFDATTMQPVGMLERLDWTPHVAPRLDCDCDKLGIMPIIRTHKDKGQEVVDSPAPSGAVNANDDKVYDVEIEVEWAATIQCRGEGAKCEGTYFPTARSEGWMIDGKKSAPVGLETHEGAGITGDVVCTGNCDGLPISIAPPPKTTYKVSVKKGAGGIITNKVSGVITLAMNPLDCEGSSWRMVIVYEADLKKGEVRIDPLLSNWDGDKKINAADKNPLDPSKN